MIRVTPTISISEEELEERFIRSPGPGGQNVNKVETAVQLRFNAANSPALTSSIFHRLRTLAGKRMTRDGVIVITANSFRSQDRNRKDALGRLIDMIRDAAQPPKYRRPTKPSFGAKQRRMDIKKQRSSVKKARGKVGPQE